MPWEFGDAYYRDLIASKQVAYDAGHRPAQHLLSISNRPGPAFNGFHRHPGMSFVTSYPNPLLPD